jgi:hypothetical protein
LLILLFVVGILVAKIIPYFAGSHTSKITSIINNLRQIDGAKQEWAIESGFTNADQVAQLTNRLTEQDLEPYLRFQTNRDGSYRSVMGEIYSVGPMSKSPEARLVRSYYSYPKGSIIRLASDTNRPPWEIIFPDGAKQRF